MKTVLMHRTFEYMQSKNTNLTNLQVFAKDYNDEPYYIVVENEL